MNTKNKFRRDKGVSQVNPNETKYDQNNLVGASTDYYTDWTTEKTNIEYSKPEKGGNSKEPHSESGQQYRNTANKHKKMNADANVSATYNEIYNRAELLIYP